jgi:hypothetical protein
MFTFSFGFFEKVCQQQQQPNTYFFFQKEATKSWFENKWEVVFFFLFPHFGKKKGLKRQIVFFFCWTKTLWGLNQEQESKCFEEVEIVFAFLLQATKKTFTVLPLAS